jgi:hypothetical protein
VHLACSAEPQKPKTIQQLSTTAATATAAICVSLCCLYILCVFLSLLQYSKGHAQGLLPSFSQTQTQYHFFW